MINLIKNNNNIILKKRRLLAWLAASIYITSLGCNSQVVYTPRGYDITKPEKFNLGSKLDEISGICWINDTLMLANEDESGRIFAINLLDPADGDYPRVKFGPKADYEDIVKVDSAIYLLVSTGILVKVTDYQVLDSVKYTVVGSLPGTNEFESLYYDKDVNSLVMLCKDCHKEKKLRSAYRFDLNSNQLIDTPYYQIHMDEIRKITHDDEVEFRPSAAAVNPIDHKVYIVSSVGKTMVVINKKGKVEQAFGISGLMFHQPEGITFAANGDMYISNEIFDEPAATLLKFKYKAP